MYFLLGYQITIGISDIALMLGRTGEMETLGSLTGRIPRLLDMGMIHSSPGKTLFLLQKRLVGQPHPLIPDTLQL